MATTFTKLISLMAYDNALTERTDDYYLRAKTQPQTLGIAEIARETATLLGKYGEDEIALILNKAEEVKCEATASGYIISTPFCLSKPVDRNADGTTRAISPGQMMQLTGRNIKLAGTDASVGILFTSVESPSTTKASARHVGPYPYKGRYTYPQREIHII